MTSTACDDQLSTELKHGQRVRLPDGIIARVIGINDNGTYTVAKPAAPDLDRTYPVTYQRHELEPVAPPTFGQKFDDEKPRLDLLIAGMPRALEEVAKVLTYGSQKYADHNWALVENAEQRYLAASTRHELALQRGETHDPETDLHHLAHKICCELFRLELSLRSLRRS